MTNFSLTDKFSEYGTNKNSVTRILVTRKLVTRKLVPRKSVTANFLLLTILRPMKKIVTKQLVTESVPPRAEKTPFLGFWGKTKTKPSFYWANNVGPDPRIQKRATFLPA